MRDAFQFNNRKIEVLKGELVQEALLLIYYLSQ